MLVLHFANVLKFNKKPQQHEFWLKCDPFIARAAQETADKLLS